MADIDLRQFEQVPTTMITKYKDMGDGTHARVVSSVINQVSGIVSTSNSTAAVLGNGEVFTGTAEDVSNYKSIGISVIASHVSAADGMAFQFSPDGTNWDIVHSFTLPAATGTFYNIPVEARYFRVVFTNSAVIQTYFRLQVLYHATMTKESTLRLSENINVELAAQLGRSVIAGLDVGSGLFKNIHSYDTGTLNALIHIPIDAFGISAILPNLSFATSGGSPLTAIASAGAGKKNRIFKMVLTADTIGTLTISDGFGAVYLTASTPVTLDFNTIGQLQTTADTAITVTNSGGGNISAHGTYKTE